MKRFFRTLVVCGLAGAAAFGAAQAQQLPRSSLTPGAVATRNVALVCTRGYAVSVRPRGNEWRRIREAVYARYGIPRGHRSFVDARGRRRPAYAIDHLIPIELGGAPADERNLWPEPIAESKRKDRVENRLHSLVCSGAIPLAAAQTAIARDWRDAVAAGQRSRPTKKR